MSKRRLLWQIFPSYLAITLAALFGVGWFSHYSFEEFYLTRVSEELQSRASFIADQIGAELRRQPDAGLLAACSHMQQSTGVRVIVIQPSGHVVCDSENHPHELEQHEPPEIHRALAGQISSATRYSPARGQRLTYVALPVKRGSEVIGVVYTSMPIAAVDRELAGIRARVIFAGVAIAMMAAVVGLIMSRRISRPLEEMRLGAERFARGELGYKLLVPQSEEMAGLAEALNQMAGQLQERISIIVRQNNQQQAVLASMVEGVLAVDSAERIISLNKATGQLLGIEENQAHGRSLQEVVRNADLRRFVSRALVCTHPIDDDLILHVDHEHDGVLQVRGAALHDAQGRGIGAVVVLNDVTDFRRLEHIRRDFVANVSHELKTPITSIKGFVETLLGGAMHNPTDTERFLNIVAKQADRLNAIIEDLLSLSKIEQGEGAGDIDLELGPIKQVIDSAVHDCQTNAADRNIHVRVACEEEVFARFNGPLLEQAVTNLLDNAIKYSDPGSEVQVLGTQTGKEVTITISDRGCGIAVEHLARIFERFYRVDKARSRKLGGTGLGLAIVKHIIQAHRGRVAVKSMPGVGSTFTLHLPLA